MGFRFRYFRLQLTADHPSERKEGLNADADADADAMEAGPFGRRGSLLRPAGHSDNCTRQVVVSAGRGEGRMAVRVLDELDLGKLMMLVHQVTKEDTSICLVYVCRQAMKP